MNTNEDLDTCSDEQANAMISGMMDEPETTSLEERINFLYEATGVILMNAINLVEKDGHPSAESIE